MTTINMKAYIFFLTHFEMAMLLLVRLSIRLLRARAKKVAIIIKSFIFFMMMHNNTMLLFESFNLSTRAKKS